MTSIRDLLGWDRGYEPIAREERNLAALLYASLLDPINVRRFLERVGCTHRVVESELAVFFEYAYLRDLWAERISHDPTLARRVILELLRPPNREWLEAAPIHDFNAYFGAAPRPSARLIQSPARWSIRCFTRNVADDDFFLRICRFKWAFNAKPDIVIHTSRASAVCIEAKLESGEGFYPSKDTEKAELTRRGLSRIGQTELQVYALRELLGLQTDFVLLVNDARKRSPSHVTLTWRQAFDALDVASPTLLLEAWRARFA